MLSNIKVKINLVRLDNEIAELSGLRSDQFTIRITGGDRYFAEDGTTILSSTTQETIPESSQTSPHLVENGARGVDFVVTGVGNDIVDQALEATEFPSYNTARDYPAAPHTHSALPNQEKYKVGTNEFITDLIGGDDGQQFFGELY